MESVEIESKRTNVGSNIETYNGQKSDNGHLGLSFGNYISKEKLFAISFAIEKIISNLKANFIRSTFSRQK